MAKDEMDDMDQGYHGRMPANSDSDDDKYGLAWRCKHSLSGNMSRCHGFEADKMAEDEMGDMDQGYHGRMLADSDSDDDKYGLAWRCKHSLSGNMSRCHGFKADKMVEDEMGDMDQGYHGRMPADSDSDDDKYGLANEKDDFIVDDVEEEKEDSDEERHRKKKNKRRKSERSYILDEDDYDLL